MAPGHVLFDLDGTLSDSAPGILAALRHAFAVTGLPPMDAATERSILGPPFYESLPPLIGDERLPEVIAAYRAHYGDTTGGGGMFNTVAYPGVAELLADLRADGVRLGVATSKPEVYAIPILEHLGLAQYFDTIGGDALDGSLGTKALVVGVVLERLGNPDPGDVVMVGDRSHDVLGARAHGVDCAAVTWGYAVPGELDAAAPRWTCATATEVAGVLRAPVL
ncbi:HAD hydrolase-like protein [Jatrophihabitans sp.]|uniref:HAD hydrolase-like protein n=1 Tax=Jatrophihabitans sp. TaxID=1932789 RepID=UPI0030C72B1D|nr:Haloacid dehalogenase domain protein hydrolase [Jatrophihabitans sp.]